MPPLGCSGTVRLPLRISVCQCHVLKWGDCAHPWFLACPVGSWMLRGLEKRSTGVATLLESGVFGAIGPRLLKS